MTKEAALKEVGLLSQKIATGETSLDQWKWNRAEAMAAAADTGASQREIGGAARMSQSAVRDALKTWREWGTHSERPAWGDAYDAATGFDRDAAQGRTDQARTKKVLREADPETVAVIVDSLTVEEQRKLDTALDTASAKRQKERERASKQKEREHLGDDTVDGLELRESLQFAESLLIKARGDLRGFVKRTGELGDDIPEAWRASCLDWIEDLEGHLGMAKALLAGDNVDWDSFDALLQKEGK